MAAWTDDDRLLLARIDERQRQAVEHMKQIKGQLEAVVATMDEHDHRIDGLESWRDTEAGRDQAQTRTANTRWVKWGVLGTWVAAIVAVAAAGCQMKGHP